MHDSSELFTALYEQNLVDINEHPLWWPEAGGFQTLLEVILTQQSRWEKVQQSIGYLKSMDMFSVDKIIAAQQWKLSSAIVPSGFYNQKAKRIIQLCKNIKEDFGSFEEFKEGVDRAWLLRQSGLGQESADAVLCYICKKEVMVVDSYTSRLLQALGFVFESYEEMQGWLESGIREHSDTILQRYEEFDSLNAVFSIFHGLIVEYCKKHCKKSGVEIIFEDRR